ncbi:helix-turn-helix domain-containing protein [Paracoccus onubensis]|uniref:helix-turn-helix domain-containing protein n=1 Tax=Paracoccus onubensis TaxID=1675788 RepID=UPI0027321486|nr:helix-turn-helix domain-containing protein [Paracoccus onubensis]MDP0928022.1 helix-turn-helix domain-containing protein [Paracoccus onubensis]
MLKYGIDPADDYRPERLTQSELSLRQEALGAFLNIAAPQLDQLFKLVGRDGQGILLTDAEGVVIDHRVHDSDSVQFQEWDLWNGADWSEAAQGTNGIGSCLVEKRRISIHQDEHFRARNIDLSCMSTPIWGPDGRPLAVLDVTSTRCEQNIQYNRLILSQITHISKIIEAMYFRASHPNSRVISISKDGGDPAALLAVDKDDIAIGATRTARRALNLDVEGDIRNIPAAELLEFNEDNPELTLNMTDRAVLLRALARSGGKVSEAARILGIGRTTMYRRMLRAGLSRTSD